MSWYRGPVPSTWGNPDVTSDSFAEPRTYELSSDCTLAKTKKPIIDHHGGVLIGSLNHFNSQRQLAAGATLYLLRGYVGKATKTNTPGVT